MSLSAQNAAAQGATAKNASTPGASAQARRRLQENKGKAATREEKAASIRRLMQSEGDAVSENTRGFNAGRYASVARLGGRYEALKKEARRIKEDAIARLPALIDELTTRIEASGGHVYLAADAADANRYIRRLCRAHGVRRLAKSKSMTSEEIEVNEALGREGVEVVETDLGEWVLQLAGEAPSHIVAPAIHKSRAAIADLFNERFEPKTPPRTAEELTRFARRKLGALIDGADAGMTGANFIAAETGTLCLVTSEGNARKSVYAPPLYVAVAGIEKIVPRLEDLAPFLELIGRSGTGQDLTSYVSLFTPPFADAAPEAAAGTTAGKTERAFHLVLIDNGRQALRADDQLRETLYCIRCSACANTCANFQSVGGHAFGGETYSGGIATGWEAGVHGLESAARFNDLCTGCSRCVPACPVGIDIPWINTVVRDRINRGDSQNAFRWLVEGLRPSGGSPGDDRAGLDLQKRVFARFGQLARWGSRMAPLSNWVAQSRPGRALMERALGIDRRRALPAFKRETLATWFRRRRRSSNADATTRKEVVLYADAYTNHVRPARGKSAVRALEALGCRVHLSAPVESGRAPLSQGCIARAEQQARRTYEALAPHLNAGRDVIVVEPTDLAMMQRDYKRLLPARACKQLQKQSVDVMAYLQSLLEEGASPHERRGGKGQKVFYHSHCQQRTLGLEGPAVQVLRCLGYEVKTSAEIECCGMAGSFGYKRAYYELSMDVGERLGEQARAMLRGKPAALLAASGTSCQEQLEALAGQETWHPVQLVAAAL